jgi:hypothetical protein
MMVCYIFAMVLILVMILGLVVFNLILLRTETVKRVEDTLDSQSTDNMLALVKEGAANISTYLYQVSIMFEMLNQMLYGMYNEDTFSIDFIASYTYEEIDTCLYDDSAYGAYPISNCSSSYLKLTDFDEDGQLLAKTSRFDYLWGTILQLTSGIAKRFIMYIETEGFVRVFPACNLPEDYDPRNQTWYKDFEDAEFTMTTTTKYNDDIGDSSPIVSLVVPLYNNETQRIGALLADIPVQYIIDQASTIYYIDTGNTTIVYKNSDILYSGTNMWTEVKRLADVNEGYFWDSLIEDEDHNDIHFLIYDDELFRVAAYTIGPSLFSTEKWWYMLLLVVKEDEIMRYEKESEDKIDLDGSILVGITLGSATITFVLVVLLIHRLSKNITEPLNGIVAFTNKINANATERDALSIDELNELREGEDQVANLVQTYKHLANSIINKREDRVTRSLENSTKKVYPPNELYGEDKVTWKDLIERLKD